MKRIILFLLLLSAYVLHVDAVENDSTPGKSDDVEYVVANANVCPVRENPSHTAEQATQLLFGELCEVVERTPGWMKIRSTVDGQVGWVTSSMLTSIPHNLVASSPDSLIAVVVTPTAIATPTDGGAPVLLTLGTRLPHYTNGTFSVLGEQYRIDPTSVNNTTQRLNIGISRDERMDKICTIAKTLLNTPYLWGGKNMMGIDCSGFTQVVYAAVGINILRNAREQITQGKAVASLSEAMPGDLAFFGHINPNTNEMKITHVGLLLSPTEIIHCAGGRVHVDRINAIGIYLPDGTKTHDLVQINRYF